MKKKEILFLVILLIMIFVLTGCKNKEENEELKNKVNASIQYLDSNLLAILNRLNNISFENYYVTTEKIRLDNNTKSTSSSSESSKSDTEGESSNEFGKEKETTITVSDMKSKNILLADKNKIDWENIKAEIENLYSSWDSIIMDLYKLGINNEDILSFSSYLDEAILNIKQENKEASLINVSNLYSLLPVFLDSYTDDRTTINIKWTKAHIVKAYAFVGNKNWNQAITEIAQATDSYNSIMGDTDFINSKTYNINKTYVCLKELQNSSVKQDEDLFYIKYKSFMEEINLL